MAVRCDHVAVTRTWVVLRAAMVAIWLVTGAAALWSAPREASYDELRADIAAQRVVEYRWGDEWARTNRTWLSPPTLTSASKLGPLFVWKTSDLRMHWTDTAQFKQVQATELDNYAGP